MRHTSKSLRKHTIGLILASSLLTSCASPRVAPISLTFHGQGSLPLSGDWGAHGNAFRTGFLNALQTDTLHTWKWTWQDNYGDPLETRTWLNSPARTHADLTLAGLGAATERLQGVQSSSPCLWLGDGSAAPFATAWPLWTDNATAQSFLDSLRAQLPAPLAVVVVADGGWSEPILASQRPNDTVVVHDPEPPRWKRETDRIQETQPASLLFWNSPRDARDVKQQSVLQQRDSLPMVLPEGVATTQRGPVWRLHPLWQPSLPADSFQIQYLTQWGYAVGNALRQSTQTRKKKPSVSEWLSLFASVAPDSLRTQRPGGGWAPRLRVYRDSLQ